MAEVTGIGVFDLEILSIEGAQVAAPLPSWELYVQVDIGVQTFQTKPSTRGTWNETFTFNVDGSQHTKISLYQTISPPSNLQRLFGEGTLLGSITEPLADFEKGQEVERGMSIVAQGSPLNIKLRIGENIFRYKCHVYALIIGIDLYACPDINPLKGCVNDANAFKSFLVNHLNVPEHQIMFLTNEDATRDAILGAFSTHLIENTKIEQGDAIILFYAGHGSRVKAPVGWAATDGFIETLCPHDERMKDDEGEEIYGIPDRTINLILRDLAAKKGDNITVIFDSCHSGGITRGSSRGIPPTARFVETPSSIQIPSSLDNHVCLMRAVDTVIPKGFKHKHMSFHILLAACRKDQYAYETTNANGPCGFFTHSLLECLRKVPLEHTTYVDLMGLFPKHTEQTPLYEGQNSNRFLFNRKAAVTDPEAFELVEAKDGYGFELHAGSVHGVVFGTEFAVLDMSTSLCKYLGTLVALEIDIGSSILSYRPETDKFDVPQGAKAVVSNWRNDKRIMKVLVELDAHDMVTLERNRMQTHGIAQTLRNSYVEVLGRDDAHISIKADPLDKENLVIERLDAIIPKFAKVETTFDTSAKVANLTFIFNAIARFNYYLLWEGENGLFASQVSVEMCKLEKSLKDGVWKPVEQAENLIVDNATTLPAMKDERYGLTVVNNSQVELFPYLFYFDPSDYSISENFITPTSLPSRNGSEPSKLAVGYGSEGGDPLKLTLSGNNLIDTGFFKLFFFNRQIDMQSLKQSSAFEASAKRKLGRGPIIVESICGAKVVAITVCIDNQL